MASSTASTSLHSITSINHISPSGSRHHSAVSYVRFRRTVPSISAAYATHNLGVPTSYSSKTSSFYELLGVEDGATCKEIKAAYRRLARALHPDVSSSNGGELDTSSVEGFIRVHEAYSTLSDPSKRADYDKMLLFKRRRMGVSKCGTTSYGGFSGYTRRSWETDQCW